MSYKDFQSIFQEILCQSPLPCGDRWTIQRLSNADLRNNKGWIEVLYRNTSKLAFLIYNLYMNCML